MNINLNNVVETVWTHSTRTLHGGGGGYTPNNAAERIANAVWNYSTRTVTTIPTVTSSADSGLPLDVLFAPHIKNEDLCNKSFNYGVVDLSWVTATNTDSSVDTSSITYEIQYTDNYVNEDTVWRNITKRIPYGTTTYKWIVGKMIKSKSVRVRIRSKTIYDESYSEWSTSCDFSVNVFDLTAPAIINPVQNALYTDFVMIILDETLTKDTFNQKVRYTLEYSSIKQNIDWTVIAYNVPAGTNVIRWNVESLPQSDDYTLRLTAKNKSTCIPQISSLPDQISTTYVYNIGIQHAGLFIIDTKPPQAVLEIEGLDRVTNQLDQVVNIYAEDQTTEVSQIQLRECRSDADLRLGNLLKDDTVVPDSEKCKSIEELLSSGSSLDTVLGKPLGNNSKIKWTFADKSGLRKLEALLTDAGGNTSIQENSKIFLPIFKSEYLINDFLVVVEQRDSVIIDDTTSPPSIVVEPSIFEVAYLGIETGDLFVLEPFSRLLYNVGSAIQKLVFFNGSLIILSYSDINKIGYIYRNDGSSATLLKNFTNSESIPKGSAEFKGNLYIGLQNGELWKYTGLTFTLITKFSNAINAVYSDTEYLYIGFQDSDVLSLYNGTSFTKLGLS